MRRSPRFWRKLAYWAENSFSRSRRNPWPIRRRAQIVQVGDRLWANSTSIPEAEALKWPTMPLWLSESDVRAALPMGELIDAMETALIAFSAGRVVQPVRTVMEIGERAFFGLMPALDPDGPMLGTKLVTVLPDNTAKGLPSHQAAIVLFDPASGALLAVTDGRYITEARTAAVSAVSVRHMARPRCGGAGDHRLRRAGAQPSGSAAAGPRFPRDPRVESERGAPATIRGGPRMSQPCDSAERAVRGADVVVLATASTTPVIDDAWVAPGAHVIAVGACRPTHRETGSAPGGARARGGGFARRRDAGSGRHSAGNRGGPHRRRTTFTPNWARWRAARRPGRQDAGQITLFKSLGLAIEDVVSAGLAYRRALASRAWRTGPAMKRFGLVALGGATVLVLGLLWARPLTPTCRRTFRVAPVPTCGGWLR